MPLYAYKGIAASGKSTHGVRDAESPKALRQLLRKDGVVVTAVDLSKGGAKARDNYLNVLKAGGSEYPYPLLKKAGLDMATAAPYQALVRRMDATIDQMEKLLAE